MQDRAQLAAEQWREQRPDLDSFAMAVIGRLGELSQVISRDHLLPFFASHGLQAMAGEERQQVITTDHLAQFAQPADHRHGEAVQIRALLTPLFSGQLCSILHVALDLSCHQDTFQKECLHLIVDQLWRQV